MNNGSRETKNCGYVAIAVTLSLAFLLGIVGLAIDLGTMYTAKNESQSFVDSAALDAALQLNGAVAGVANALAAVAANPKKWRFGTSDFSNVTVTFSTAPYGPFVSSDSLPDPPTGYLFARVETEVGVPLLFLPMLVGTDVGTVRARAVAGRSAVTSFSQGLFPFSPFTHDLPGGTPGCPVGDPGDPFGFKVGERYTLRWGTGNIDPTKPKDLKLACPGDKCAAVLAVAAVTTSERGYILLNSASGIRESIVSDMGYFAPVTVGSCLRDLAQGVPPGTKNSEMNALAERVLQDTDSVSKEYGPTPELYTHNSYKYKIDHRENGPRGNGRRVVVVPVTAGWVNNWTVTGFAAFFLDGTANDYDKLGGNEPACAEYIGDVTLGGAWTGGGGGGGGAVYRVRLFE